MCSTSNLLMLSGSAVIDRHPAPHAPRLILDCRDVTHYNCSLAMSTRIKKSDLPPPRKTPSMRPVSPPLSHTRLTSLIYVLVLLSALLVAFYSYRMVQYKNQVGNWWDFAIGQRPPIYHTQNNHHSPNGEFRGEASKIEDESVEGKITALAQALGIPTKDLASAIAVAVREYVPPASLSSIAAEETGPAVKVMLESARHVR